MTGVIRTLGNNLRNRRRPKPLSLARRLLLPPLSPLLNLPPLLLTRTPPFTRLIRTADR